MNTLFEAPWLADLTTELPPNVRLQRLIGGLRAHFCCGAVALLRLEEEHLRPVVVDGLVSESLGRRFAVHQHPRLAALLARGEVTCFDHDSTLPDPYDGLLDALVGEPLPVHDCMGVALRMDGRPWGVLTLDALQTGTFDDAARAALAHCAVHVEAAIRMTRLEQENQALSRAGSPYAGDATDEPALRAALDEGEILGQSEVLTRLLQEMKLVATSDLPVLLLGETGVGKELFARLLHRHSPRRHKPLVHVNCAALPESLAESELFGHRRGAFSGAVTDRPGRFEAAEGGTLFLDEVGELPLSVQAKLLRTLQNGEIQRLGADEPRRVNVRVVAATNRHLRDLVATGSFRADLYHRLSVYPVPIPPLREREGDVLLLAGRFLEQNRARLGLRSLRLSSAAQAALRGYHWPGNIRELSNLIERLMIMVPSETIDPSHIGLLLQSHSTASGGSATAPSPLATKNFDSLKDARNAFEREYISRKLREHNWNVSRTADDLKIERSHLHRKIKLLNVELRPEN